jgi:hypothetical protein
MAEVIHRNADGHVELVESDQKVTAESDRRGDRGLVEAVNDSDERYSKDKLVEPVVESELVVPEVKDEPAEKPKASAPKKSDD